MASRTSCVVVNREALVVDERLTKCLRHLSKAKLRRARCRGCQLVQSLSEIHLNGWDEEGSHVDILMRSTREVLCDIQYRDWYCHTSRLDTGRRRRRRRSKGNRVRSGGGKRVWNRGGPRGGWRGGPRVEALGE